MDYRITPRELEVLWAVAQTGDSVAGAESLGMSFQTAKNHLWSLRKKVGATSTLQAYHILMGRPRFTVTHTMTLGVEEEST